MAGRKTTFNYQFGVTCDINGNASHPSLIGVPDFGRAPLLDNHGRLIVRVAGPAGFTPMTCETPLYAQGQANAYVTQAQITTGETVLQNTFGFVVSAAPRWIQLHDVNIPLVGGEVPEITIPVPAGTPPAGVAWSIAVPWIFQAGCHIACSSTGPSFTDPGADEMWWNFVGSYCPSAPP